MNKINLIFTSGLLVCILCISAPMASANGYNAEGASSKGSESKQPASEKKTFSPTPPKIRIV